MASVKRLSRSHNGEMRKEGPGANPSGPSPLIGGDVSLQAVAWVLDFSKSSGLEKLVLIYLANYHNLKEKAAWPSIGRLAVAAGVSESTVKRCLASLEKLGEIRIIERKKEEGGNLSNYYKLPIFEGKRERDLKEVGRGFLENETGFLQDPKGFLQDRNPVIEPVIEPVREEAIEPSPLKEDPKQVFRECKRYYRRTVRKSPGNLPSYCEESWLNWIEKKTGDVIFEVWKLWVDENKEWLKKVNWPFAMFMKKIAEHVEAYEDTLAGERDEETDEEVHLPALRPRAQE
jgi:Helix-turn-helix domain